MNETQSFIKPQEDFRKEQKVMWEGCAFILGEKSHRQKVKPLTEGVD